MMIVSRIRPTMTKVLPNNISLFLITSLLVTTYVNKYSIPISMYINAKYINNNGGAIKNESNKLKHSNKGYRQILRIPYRNITLTKTVIIPSNIYGKAKATPTQNNQVILLIHPKMMITIEMPLITMDPKILFASSLVV